MNCSGNTPEQEQQATKTEVNQKEMPHSKYHEYIANKQDVTYTEMKTYKSPQKHRTPTAKQSPVVLSDEQVKYAELTFHRTPQFQPRKLPVRRKRQGPKWRVVTSMLGALCVVLMTTVGILLPKLLSSQEEQSRQTSFPPLLCPKEDDSSYDLCSSDWIAFGNHFYQAFHGTKTWAESQSACEELKSHLVIIDSEEELENLLLFEIEGWILLKKDGTNRSWLWGNDGKTQHTLIYDSEKNNSCHYLRGNQFISGDCSSRKSYTCEFNIRNPEH
ncbi:killer cell lectin-like receptor subfamily I member 1 isoform X2 [Grammomys surdaster]|uniref:killer cell lectin-like receptor subfamily I member 1 isoform X2 n=1 Tax=Grammomys surdaster TaxID=491861 RepID=UPI0010A06934|nr:killer cell lectin-like receptor subfamily I member 1 isoform X2 [Grammomys surdaster]